MIINFGHPAEKSDAYAVCVKRNTHLIPDFLWPGHWPPAPGGGGPKIHMVDYLNGSSTHAQSFSLKEIEAV